MTAIPPPPTDGLYKIESVLKGEATSVNDLIPLPFQVVRLGLRSHVWELKQRGNLVYHLSIKDAYRYTGELEKKVVATIEEEKNLPWHITYRHYANAYTIEPVFDHNKGWTVASESDPESEIVIEELKYIPDINPPAVLPPQLFKFVKV